MTEIRNIRNIGKVLKDIAETSIKEVSKDVTKQVRANIMKYVYENEYFPNKHYYNGSGRPTFQFLRAFKWKPFSRSGNILSKKLFYDYESMTFNADTWLHGSNVPGWGDAREHLADILNINGRRSLLKIGDSYMAKKVKPYWDITIEELFDENGLSDMFDKELTKFGNFLKK